MWSRALTVHEGEALMYSTRYHAVGTGTHVHLYITLRTRMHVVGSVPPSHHAYPCLAVPAKTWIDTQSQHWHVDVLGAATHPHD